MIMSCTNSTSTVQSLVQEEPVLEDLQLVDVERHFGLQEVKHVVHMVALDVYGDRVGELGGLNVCDGV